MRNGFTKNDLVRCLETERLGIVVDVRRGGDATMVCVLWNETAQRNWVDAVELELVSFG